VIAYLLPVLTIAVLACLANGRVGIGLCLAFGMLMDPVRKVATGQPVWMSGVVAGLAAATFAGVWLRGDARPFADVRARFPALGTALGVGLLWVLIEAARGYVLTGSLAVAAIGLVAYAAPAMAFLVAYAVLRTPADFERFARLYLAGVAVMLAASFLSHLGTRHVLLDQVGLGLHIHADGRTIDARGGLFRGLEMAGWHAAAALGLLFVLGVAARRRASIWLLLPAGLSLVYGLLASARRKYIVQLVAFLALWAALGWLYRRSRQAGAWAALGVIATGVAFVSVDPSPTTARRERPNGGLRRLEQLEGDSSRVKYLAVTALADVYQQNGFLGSGAGTASQGAQYFGAGNNRIVGFAGEGGLGKVLGELGVPGLFLLGWLGIAFLGAALSAVSAAEARHPGAPDVATGVLALLGSNVAVFVIAHQVFGDPFVLVTLGLLAGGLLRLAAVEADDDAVEGSEVVT